MDPNDSTTLTFVAAVSITAFIVAGDVLVPSLQSGSMGAMEIFAGINWRMREFIRLLLKLHVPYCLVKMEDYDTSDTRYGKYTLRPKGKES